MRLAAYAGASVALATGVFLKALHQRANFYAACVYLSQSSANLMILTNLCLLVTGFVLFWLQRLLYGPLRPIETEQLYERAWFAVTETCLAMTIFRGELGGWFLVMFISLLVGKVWGWIGEGRVEYLEQQPRQTLDYFIHASPPRWYSRPDMMVMFGFEFAILTILSSSTTARYGIALVEIYVTRQQLKTRMDERRAEIREARLEAIREHARAGESSPPADLPDENDIDELEIDVPGWEEKGRWVFYLDLLTDFVKLVVYLVFFAILLTFYGLPIHILRDVVVTIRSFARRIMDFLRYRNATRDMNERYPDASPEEVAREEVCIICREEMVSVQPAAAAGDAAGEGAPPPAAGTQRVPDRLRPRNFLVNCPTCRRPVVGAAAAAARGAVGANANNAANGAGGFPPNQVPGQPGAQGDGAPRARVYQFGPFRIGFGAVRGGDLFNNLHQQIHQGNAPLQPAANANPQGARQIGFGFGFGRRPPVPTPHGQHHPAPTSNIADVHTQLQHIEQQITQEIISLRAATEQFQHVRNLQLELDRLRQEQANIAAPTTSSTAAAPQPGPSGTSARQFVAGPGSSVLSAGDSRLPEGLNLPPGWTLVPLQPNEQNGQNAPQTVSPTATTSLFPSAQSTTRVHQPPANSSNETAGSTAPIPTPETSTTETQSTAPPTLPSWGMPNGSSTSADHRAESPSQEWTDVQSEQVPETGPSTIPTSWGSGAQPTKEATEEEGSTYSESASKGKARAATVEEAEADENAL
ncbi:Zinc finger RING-type [Penicillium cosmopolitanum]|uniref:Zinc finger RING-type n=1 Tax=Penicillium cosmopolitanum TaxID=1131564 RepID=A0A9W9W7R6_9EURO|nr:Zinc finger RING-type [Penicillium cosmopolitanum]KAJ5407960.1 Zinc finger RING-type [Penicillium cosmopolitanum]